MPAAATMIPGEDLLLCEACGYIISGLPPDSSCPECGRPSTDSSPDKRSPPEWEVAPHPTFRLFISTTIRLIFHTADFFRRFNTRSDNRRSILFARIHTFVASILLGFALYLQALWINEFSRWTLRNSDGRVQAAFTYFLGPLGAITLTYLYLTVTTRAAARLTAWEAGYRGLRLPHRVVIRGLHYHTAHYLPVALVALITIAGYQTLAAAHYFSVFSDTRYLYVLCAEVIFAAAYLFKTYWTAMRNMMYANS